MKRVFDLACSLTSGYRRIAALLITFPVLWACNARTLTAPDEHPVQVGTEVFQQTLNREIDILFMIDDSPSMLPLQAKLLANFPVFMNVLKNLPMGLPDVHIAVVSQNRAPASSTCLNTTVRLAGIAGNSSFSRPAPARRRR